MIMNELFLGISLLMDCISILLIYMIVMGAKLKYPIYKTLIVLCTVVAIVTLVICPIDIELREVLALVSYIPCVFLLEGSKKKWISLFLPNIITLSVVQTIFLAVFSFSNGRIENNVYRAFIGVIVVIGLAVAYYFVRSLQGAEYEYSYGQIIFLNLISLCLFVLLGEIQRFFDDKTTMFMNRETSGLIHNAMLVACILLCILAFYLSVIKRRLDDAKRIAEENEFLLRMQSEQMDTVIKSEEKLHAFKHDLITHLNALSAFADEGDVAKVKDYCGSLLADTRSFARVAYTGNPALDGVLQQLKGMANDKGVELDIRMTVPKEKKISDYDLCILTSNIVKNAIEANESGGKVEIKTWPFNENLCILSSNTTTHPLEYRKGVLLSTKRQYKAPGYGMRNIQAVIDKYDGDFQIKMEGDLVKVEALV